ncbi:hypothetical protein TpMuguga_01g02815 [Theileria parva strain Muguga]|uniref:uncharacterized protein n=1 Tax=Theileria parva strain Muguga TaxID=333668 RepID=UPI001C61EC09|nr:uncharacterized protein TpMuguga_01g02815 [Theileria parva strain Muguga]KAF5153496.1 hypothetical protein TpMuguga_01g02815 [Theileria parva strain Muguga]
MLYRKKSSTVISRRPTLSVLLKNNVLYCLNMAKSYFFATGQDLELESLSSTENRLILYYLDNLSDSVSDIILSSTSDTLGIALSMLELDVGATKPEIKTRIERLISEKIKV